MKCKSTFFIILYIFSLKITAQETKTSSVVFDKVNIGFGAGMEYGGLIGANLGWYVHKNISIFGAYGILFPGGGYNVGSKIRWRKETQSSKISPYAICMYGTNSYIKIESGTKSSTAYSGLSLGGGVDFGPKNKGYFSLSIIYPFRPEKFDEDLYLLKIRGYKQTNDIYPVSFSVGYKFVIGKY